MIYPAYVHLRSVIWFLTMRQRLTSVGALRLSGWKVINVVDASIPLPTLKGGNLPVTTISSLCCCYGQCTHVFLLKEQTRFFLTATPCKIQTAPIIKVIEHAACFLPLTEGTCEWSPLPVSLISASPPLDTMIDEFSAPSKPKCLSESFCVIAMVSSKLFGQTLCKKRSLSLSVSKIFYRDLLKVRQSWRLHVSMFLIFYNRISLYITN